MAGGNGGPGLAVPGDSNAAGLCPLSGCLTPWVERENEANDHKRHKREVHACSRTSVRSILLNIVMSSL